MKQLVTLLLQRKIQYELRVLFVYIHDFVLSRRCRFIGWGWLKGGRTVGELGEAAEADHPMVRWAGQFPGFCTVLSKPIYSELR